MTVAKIYTYPKKRKKNGEISIFITVNLQYKKLFFSTGISCMPDKFDQKTGHITGNTKKVNDDNLIIDRCMATMNEIFVRYRLQDIVLTPELLKQEWRNPSRRIDFYAFMDECIKERRNDIAESTINQHQSALEKMKKFRKKLAFAEIDQEFIESYRRWLKAAPQNNDINTIHNAMKIFKVYMNIAKRKKVISVSAFDGYQIKRAHPERTFLTEPELELLWLRYKKNYLNETDQLVLRHFLFMCFTGLRISDLKTITPDSIVGDMLIYFPHKTRNNKRAAVKVPLNSWAKQLIADEKSITKNLFNCLSEQKMNEKIKLIVQVDKIKKDVSNHIARHTFATLWLMKTHDVAGLQKLLGHSDISMTMIYVHITDTMVNDQMRNFESSLFKKPSELKNPATTREAGKI